VAETLRPFPNIARPKDHLLEVIVGLAKIMHGGCKQNARSKTSAKALWFQPDGAKLIVARRFKDRDSCAVHLP
jgi:hypothetical protein